MQNGTEEVEFINSVDFYGATTVCWELCIEQRTSFVLSLNEELCIEQGTSFMLSLNLMGNIEGKRSRSQVM